MNFDGASSTVKQKASMGVVVRNSKRKCLSIRAKQRNFSSPLMIESEATLLGIHTAILMGVKKLVVEDVAKTVINTMNESLEEFPNEIRNCIHECKNFLNTLITFIYNS